jgi:two-component system cell cycle sensor histidine kinase/response regulator CckA
LTGPAMRKEMRRANPGLKTVFVSGYAEEAFQKNLPPDVSQYSFLTKPFTLEQLVAPVKETMAAE